MQEQIAAKLVTSQRCLLPLQGVAPKGAIGVEEFKRCFAEMLQHGPGLEAIYKDRPMAVAVSGGPDSTALVMLMRRAFPNATINAYMVDHGMDTVGVSEEPERVRRLMSEAGVGFRGLTVDWSDTPIDKLTVGKRLLRAREKRYELLASACAQDDVGLLLLGHNLDDDIVTMFYRMSRFSGLDGITGMRPLTTLPTTSPNGANALLGRPLLDIEKYRLLETCKVMSVNVTMDESNDCLEYSRNQILQTLSHLQHSHPDRFSTNKLRSLLLSMKEHYRTVHERIVVAMNQSVFVNPRQGSAVIVANNHASLMDTPVWNRIISYLLQFVGARLTPPRTTSINEIVSSLQASSKAHHGRERMNQQRDAKLASVMNNPVSPFQIALPSDKTGRVNMSTLVAGGCVVYPLARTDAALRIESIKKTTDRADIEYGPACLVQSEFSQKTNRVVTKSLAPNEHVLYDGRFWLHYNTLNPGGSALPLRIEPLTPELANQFKRLCHKYQATFPKRALQAFQAVTPGTMLYNVPVVTAPTVDPDYMALPCVDQGVQVGGLKMPMSLQWVVYHAGQQTLYSKFHCKP
jgi:tRNA(Ile)-lysidine synthetase-like protein